MHRGLRMSILIALMVILVGSVYLLFFSDESAFPGTEKQSSEFSREADPDALEANGIPSVTPTQTSNPKEAAMANFLSKVQSMEDKMILDIDYISQEPDYPTGCESVSAVMLLNYMGVNITVDNFIDTCLEKGDIIVRNKQYYAPDPSVKFVGNPRGSGFGCYAPVIINALEKAAPDFYVLDESEKELSYLVDTYVKRQTPVLIWATMNMTESKEGEKWIIDNSITAGASVGENVNIESEIPKGAQTVTWIAGEHCMVLVGYDQNSYYMADPYKSNGIKAYRKDLVEQRYEELNMQAVTMIAK